MSLIEDLLLDIERFLAETGIAPSTFGRQAVNDGKFVGRLRAGADVTVGTVDRVRAYMASEKAKLAAPDPASVPVAPEDTEVPAAVPDATFPGRAVPKAAA